MPAVSDPGTWRLGPEVAAATQGLVASPFAHLPYGVALLLDSSAAPGGAWLRALRDPAQGCLRVTDATGKDVDGEGAAAGCAAMAFTAPGLRLLGLEQAVLDSFSQPFVEGMHTVNRRRRLGDALLDPPTRARRPLWGSNAAAVANPDAVVCERTVHAAVLLYHETPDKLAAYAAPVRACLHASGVSVVHELSLSLMFDESTPPLSREHFGFADGISQPVPFGDAIVTDAGAAYPAHPVHGVAAGDLLLGHINAHDEPSPAPVVAARAPHAALLPAAPAAGYASLGMNGSFLVMRELSQDVEAFWRSMADAARQLGHGDAAWVAERVVGRGKDGVVLAKTAPPPSKDGPGNDFLYFDGDAGGRFCPLGSHVRRSNPRDGLAPDAGSTATLLKAANNHRILRRGRKYAAYDVPDAPRLPGLLFMCLNTDLERQFEFVQQSWLMNPSFAALFGEHDPLLGPAGPFTIPADPLRLRPDVATFVQLIGGEYFFLPSLPALEFLARAGTSA